MANVVSTAPARFNSATVGLGVLVGLGVDVGAGGRVGLGVDVGAGLLVGALVGTAVGITGGVVGTGVPEEQGTDKFRGSKDPQITISLESDAWLILVSASLLGLQSRVIVEDPVTKGLITNVANSVSVLDFFA
jgi:hypothetical protein